MLHLIVERFLALLVKWLLINQTRYFFVIPPLNEMKALIMKYFMALLLITIILIIGLLLVNTLILRQISLILS